APLMDNIWEAATVPATSSFCADAGVPIPTFPPATEKASTFDLSVPLISPEGPPATASERLILADPSKGTPPIVLAVVSLTDWLAMSAVLAKIALLAFTPVRPAPLP